ncbi:serine/threonine-protein kinase [Nocardioides sp. GXQ0305]|uniref:serine/threonine-protein kinase n=1 Tax=Nocardioides sp. GXQ0305 TaxID=3423912 RepID=UPI003D7CBD58
MIGRERAEALSPVPVGEELLPGYRVVALMAHGRRLDTYDAVDEDRDCRVVVKLLREDRRHDPRVVASVLQEGRLVTSLAHPHLVRGLAAFEVPAPAMVLETLTGATLGALVEDRPLAATDVAQLGLQLVSVLGYLHRRDWLHLDLKPANVVVQHGRAVLLDLSLAGRPGAGRPGAGTRGYLSPEQALGQGLSPASDVFGLGVTLHECLTGELPFGDEATWESRRRWPLVHRRLPRRPDVLPDGVPREMSDLLAGCLSLDPADRPDLGRVKDVCTALAE